MVNLSFLLVTCCQMSMLNNVFHIFVSPLFSFIFSHAPIFFSEEPSTQPRKNKKVMFLEVEIQD